MSVKKTSEVITCVQGITQAMIDTSGAKTILVPYSGHWLIPAKCFWDLVSRARRYTKLPHDADPLRALTLACWQAGDWWIESQLNELRDIEAKEQKNLDHHWAKAAQGASHNRS